MMRCGIEKTNETSESLIDNEEKWLNRQLSLGSTRYSGMSLEDLRDLPTVLSLRNDLVLPRFHRLPQTLEREGSLLELPLGVLKGYFISCFFILFYFVWDSRVNN